jgi:hypothetical protein
MSQEREKYRTYIPPSDRDYTKPPKKVAKKKVTKKKVAKKKVTKKKAG